jgi:hypothetical protein
MKLVPQFVTRGIGRTVLQTKKNSPHIFFAGGMIGIAGSTFLACRATLKLEKTVDEIKDDFDILHKLHAGDVEVEGKTIQKYTDDEYRKALLVVYGKSGLKVAKLYGPSILLGSASIAALTGSHVQLTRRNSALSATLALVTQAYDEYRARVREEVGEKRELELYRDIRDVEIENEKGKKETVQVAQSTGGSIYARWFDERSYCWEPHPETNKIALSAKQNYFNQRLNVYGHVFLNEVYDALGLERSPAGSQVGWLKDGGPDNTGDGYIDFGLFELRNMDFNMGREFSILLDFNVDGVIWDKI